MQHDQLYYPYPSQRVTTVAQRGMVATSQPLAAQVGLDMLKKGGNAIDAAIATAACLTVVEPTSNGIGGDAYALVWVKGKLHGLNASGPAPQSISLEAVKQLGYDEMPTHGWIPVTVPGAPAAWAELSARFGKLPFAELLQPAIDYAEQGYPLSPTLAKYWKSAVKSYAAKLNPQHEPQYAPWFETFAPSGDAPGIGQIWRSPGHAETLRQIAATASESFYRGELAAQIDRFSQQYGGFLSLDDLASYKVEWVEPLSVNYRGYDIWEIPPNGQGLVALMTLNMMQQYAMPENHTEESLHQQIEALKLSFVDGHQFITDAGDMDVRIEDLLSAEYAAGRRKQIDELAQLPVPGTPPKGGTVYLATADQEGNMVSFIQSNYMGFGSGIVVPGTGIALQNRGRGFSLDPTHVNRLAPGKRPYHTIIPGFITQGEQAIGPFGVMGGFMQPQGHVQVVTNMIDFGLNPQAALDAPRWNWTEGNRILVEHHFPQHLAQALARRGHDIQVALDSGAFGRGQMIWRDQATGIFIGGTESRTDGAVVGW